MASVDNSAWDGPAAMSAAAKSSNPAAAFKAICAGRREGDPELEKTWALPHHKSPGAPPNAKGVRNAESQLPQTDGLTNKEAAQSHLDSHMKVIQAAEKGQLTPALVREARAQHDAMVPGGMARLSRFPSELRVNLVTREGKQFYEVEGYASVFERGYTMYDSIGEYTEIIDRSAFDKSLANAPDVAFLVNHRGVTMARTANETLQLASDGIGLHVRAWLNAERQDVRDFASAVRDKLVTEMSFAFMLNDGRWNDDYSEYRILEADINRGDVSGVNYGANPYTSIEARAAEWLQMTEDIPETWAAAAIAKLAARSDGEAIIGRAQSEMEEAAQHLADEAVARYQRAAKLDNNSSADEADTTEGRKRTGSVDMAGKRYKALYG